MILFYCDNNGERISQDYYSRDRKEICKKRWMQYHDDVDKKFQYYQDNKRQMSELRRNR